MIVNCTDDGSGTAFTVIDRLSDSESKEPIPDAEVWPRPVRNPKLMALPAVEKSGCCVEFIVLVVKSYNEKSVACKPVAEMVCQVPAKNAGPVIWSI